MIIFLYGPDDYRREQKKKEILAEFLKKKSGLGRDSFDLEAKDGMERLQEFLKNQSIFESAKLAVLENAFEMEAAKLAKVLQPFVSEKGIQILLSEKSKPLKALSFLLEKPVIFQKFETLTEMEQTAFIRTESRALGLTLDAAAAQFLGRVYQANSWGLVTELQKLSALRSTITRKDLDSMDLEVAPDYWALLNALKGYDIKNRLYAFEKMLSLNDPPPKIFNILASQWREKIPRMAEYDFAVKSGKMDYEEALLDLLIS